MGGSKLYGGGGTAKARYAQLREQLDDLAEMRRQVDDSEMPEDLRQIILNLRQILREEGFSEEMIDETRGLEAP